MYFHIFSMYLTFLVEFYFFACPIQCEGYHITSTIEINFQQLILGLGSVERWETSADHDV